MSASGPQGAGQSALAVVDTVVKVGGSLLSRIEVLDAVLAEIAAAPRDISLLVVPGGGRFADAVRRTDREIGLGGDTAHWMAVLAMDQYAHVLAERLPGGRIIFGPGAIAGASRTAGVPVLAPFQWLRQVDPLPHSWDITADSIAAWTAAQLGARRLVLVKHAGASGPALVDRAFASVLAGRLAAEIVTADRLDRLRTLLGPHSARSA